MGRTLVALQPQADRYLTFLVAEQRQAVHCGRISEIGFVIGATRPAFRIARRTVSARLRPRGWLIMEQQRIN